MSEKYIRLYAMKQIVAYKGPAKPDDPTAPGGGSGPPAPPPKGMDDINSQFLSEKNQNEDKIDIKRDDSFDGFFKDVLGDVNPASLEEGQTVTGWVGFGISVQSCLYQDENLRRNIRMYTIVKAKQLFEKGVMIPLNNLKDGLSLSAFRVAQITLVAQSDTSIYPLYGKIHTTTMVISTVVNLDELSKYLRNATIEIGEKKIKYKLKPGTFVIKPVKLPAQEVAEVRKNRPPFLFRHLFKPRQAWASLKPTWCQSLSVTLSPTPR